MVCSVEIDTYVVGITLTRTFVYLQAFRSASKNARRRLPVRFMLPLLLQYYRVRAVSRPSPKGRCENQSNLRNQIKRERDYNI